MCNRIYNHMNKRTIYERDMANLKMREERKHHDTRSRRPQHVSARCDALQHDVVSYGRMWYARTATLPCMYRLEESLFRVPGCWTQRGVAPSSSNCLSRARSMQKCLESITVHSLFGEGCAEDKVPFCVPIMRHSTLRVSTRGSA